MTSSVTLWIWVKLKDDFQAIRGHERFARGPLEPEVNSQVTKREYNKVWRLTVHPRFLR